jgi:hypothetical protein
MASTEKELIRRLLNLQEGIQDLHETLKAISESLKDDRITDHTREMIVTMLPENPETALPPHRLYDAEQMIDQLMHSEVDNGILLRFRDYFEKVQDFYSSEIRQIRVKMHQLEESKLQELNDWWRGCSADEREIGYEAIAELLKSKKSAHILAKATRSKRVKLLSHAKTAVTRAKEEAIRQTKAWKMLSGTERANALTAVQKAIGMPANTWWAKASLLERNRVLGEVLTTLASVNSQTKHSSKMG